MISGNNYERVEINITTYKYKIPKTMNEDLTFDRRIHKNDTNKYICSICLNRKPENDKNIEGNKRKSKSCPICQRRYLDNCTIQNDYKDNESDKTEVALCEYKERSGKNTQTSQSDVTRDVSLLNEVLTVFQSKKETEIKKGVPKTIILKDASVNTEDAKRHPKLSISKIFFYTIEENSQQNNSKFIIINCQPESTKVSQFSIDIMNRKSSSIPQMKLEELKKSLKEKTKSKDAIEEVNRMFATVRKSDIDDKLEIPNRPIVRSGPRVLPVVKTINKNTETKSKHENKCTHCQTNYKMSSGDSYECCHGTNNRCEECFYMMCHYQHCVNSMSTCPRCTTNCEHVKNSNIHVG